MEVLLDDGTFPRGLRQFSCLIEEYMGSDARRYFGDIVNYYESEIHFFATQLNDEGEWSS